VKQMINSKLETIAAIATPIGVGGVAVIRISGQKSKDILKNIFPSFTKILSHKMLNGWIVDPKKRNKVDRVMACFMRAPKSYTGEDVVEIYCHGGVAVANKILSLIFSSGAVIASRGEFSKRAFLNGKFDLIQAEAILDLVKAPTEKGAGYAVSQLEGKLSKTIQGQRSELVGLLAQVEAQIDFADDMPPLNFAVFTRKTKGVLKAIENLVNAGYGGKIFRQGVSVAIVGRPNVGKSSLLNALLNEERAIVTEEPGTTRDSLVEQINLDGLVVRLIDTAGLRSPRSMAEKAGIKRAQKEVLFADYLIAVFDRSQKISSQDEATILAIKNKKGLVVLNKTDLPEQLKSEKINKSLSQWKAIKISALFGQGIPKLAKELKKLILKDNGVSQNTVTFLNARHLECLQRAGEALKRSLSIIKQGSSPDLLALDIKAAILALREVSGAEVSDEVINEVFDQFCVGK